MDRVVAWGALTDPIPAGAVRAFRRSKRAVPGYGGVTGAAVAIWTVVGAVVFAAAAAAVSLPLVAPLIEGERGPVAVIATVFAVFFGLTATAVIVSAAVAAIRAVRGRWAQWYRLDAFAAANGLRFSPQDPGPAYPGAIFGLGGDRRVTDHLRSGDGRYLDYGNYRYTTGSGRSRSAHAWGFLAIRLDRALPHMVLDSTANNGLFGATNLPSRFARDQVLSLEGDFDRHFTLYCPTAYERDALYVFTPDLMALLIDHANGLDVEIVDQWLFVTSATPFRMLDPAVHRRLLRIVDTVGAKTLSQTDRYADERIDSFAANAVAGPGRRLRRAVPVLGIVLAAAFIAFWVWGVVNGD